MYRTSSPVFSLGPFYNFIFLHDIVSPLLLMKEYLAHPLLFTFISAVKVNGETHANKLRKLTIGSLKSYKYRN